MNCKAVIVPTVLLAMSVVATFAQGPAYAQYQGTGPDQAACRPDVRRYCRQIGGDQMRVLACLQDHRRQLSRRCRGVLERNGQ
jgi:hypothetical protein